MTKEIRGEQSELRGDISKHLLQAADALAQVADMTRIRWVEQLIQREVEMKLHQLTVLNRMLRGNPLLSDSATKSPHLSDK